VPESGVTALTAFTTGLDLITTMASHIESVFDAALEAHESGRSGVVVRRDSTTDAAGVAAAAHGEEAGAGGAGAEAKDVDVDMAAAGAAVPPPAPGRSKRSATAKAELAGAGGGDKRG